MRSVFVGLMAVLVLSACWSLPGAKPNASIKDANPLVAAAAVTDTTKKNASEAAEQVSAETLHATAEVLADINDAASANEGNPAGNPKTVVAGDLSVAQGRLKNIEPDPAEAAAVAQRRALVEAGKAKDAQKAYEDASKKAEDAAEQLEKLQAKADLLEKQAQDARDSEATARAKFLTEIEQNRVDAQKQIQKAHDDANNEVLHKQVLYLNIGGAGCLLVFGLAAGFGGFAGLKVSWPFGVFALLCFGLAQIVSQWWFMWAVGGVVLVAMGVAIYWIRKHQELGDLAAAAQEKSSQVQSVLSKVVPVVDNAYDAAEAPVKAFLDDKIFDPLSKTLMTAIDKATVHQVRAQNAAPVA